jgi:hypothetical protein
MSETARSLRDRLRARTGQPLDQALSLVKTGNPPSQPIAGLQTTLQSQVQSTELDIFSAPDLRTRMVRYFQFIGNNMPAGSFSPLVQALMRRLFPMVAKEVNERFTEDDMERTGVTALLILAKLYRPNADRVILDFAAGTMNVLDEGDVKSELSEEDRLLLEAADNELLAPPPPDLQQLPVVDDEPMVGVLMPDGKVVQMKQSQYQSLMAAEAHADAVE